MGMGFAPTWLRQVRPLLHKTTLTTGYKCTNGRHRRTNTQLYRPDAFHVTQPTVSKHWRMELTLSSARAVNAGRVQKCISRPMWLSFRAVVKLICQEPVICNVFVAATYEWIKIDRISLLISETVQDRDCWCLVALRHLSELDKLGPWTQDRAT